MLRKDYHIASGKSITVLHVVQRSVANLTDQFASPNRTWATTPFILQTRACWIASNS